AARAGHIPGRAPDRVDPADGRQRDEPDPDAVHLLPGSAPFRPFGGRHRAGRDVNRLDNRDEESVTQEDMTAESRTEQEVASQPTCWRHAARLAADVAGSLPAPGERVAVAGGGTSRLVEPSCA